MLPQICLQRCNDYKTPAPKSSHEEIAAQVAAFEASGGEVTVCPSYTQGGGLTGAGVTDFAVWNINPSSRFGETGVVA